tara:strand:- start:154 stop:492 length:339 start_codon:yes stop_codon:yes gene_type:complete
MNKESNRKFIPSNSEQNHDAFNRIMHEIHPKKIPANFVDKIKLFHRDGSTSMLTSDDIYNTIPVKGQVDWDKVAENYHDIVNMEIYIDMDSLEHTVHKNVHRMFKNIFDKKN